MTDVILVLLSLIQAGILVSSLLKLLADSLIDCSFTNTTCALFIGPSAKPPNPQLGFRLIFEVSQNFRGTMGSNMSAWSRFASVRDVISQSVFSGSCLVWGKYNGITRRIE